MISDGAFSIFKRFSAIEKPFQEMPREENNYFLEALEGFKGTFKSSMSSRVQEFNSSPFRHAQCNALLPLQRGKHIYGKKYTTMTQG